MGRRSPLFYRGENPHESHSHTSRIRCGRGKEEEHPIGRSTVCKAAADRSVPFVPLRRGQCNPGRRSAWAEDPGAQGGFCVERSGQEGTRVSHGNRSEAMVAEVATCILFPARARST